MQPGFAAGWQRIAAGLVLLLWIVVSVARLTKLIEAPEVPVGEDVRRFVTFAQAVIPEDAAYLYVEPRAYGTETGIGPRLRYELFPRRYDDISGPTSEQAVRDLARQDGARYILVPDASSLPADHFLLGSAPWFHRVQLDANRYVVLVDQP